MNWANIHGILNNLYLGEECAMVRYDTVSGVLEPGTDGLVLTSTDEGEYQLIGPLPPPHHSQPPQTLNVNGEEVSMPCQAWNRCDRGSVCYSIMFLSLGQFRKQAQN